jgi:serine/threonine protein kinase
VAKIGDFGLSLRVNKEVGGSLKTWQWLAPEVLSSESAGYDEKSDCFSLGIILWELLTLSIPYAEYKQDPLYFNGKEWLLQPIKGAIINEGLRPTIPEDCLPYYADILRGCWQTNPKERLSAAQVTHLLEQSNSFLVEAINARKGSIPV